jgi:hypothetical protein
MGVMQICVERNDLLEAASTAIDEYAAHARLLSEATTRTNYAVFVEVAARVRASLDTVDGALDVYRKHVNEHGC